ncbi:MAG TPA: DNA replication/repair protein RecF [Rhodanobacteraceae bacterium]|nr:DNA replication/repair protein RecF [Rhodanobacteraceae bacterium]
MRLRQLRLENLRAFQSLDLDLDPGWNVFVGANGAGKTTLLEGAYLLSHARSFRSGPKDVLIRRGSDGFSVYGRVERAGMSEALGLARAGGALEARINGTPVAIADLLRHAAVACFEPGSHELLSGASDIRRRFLDWGVFHVEPEFLRVWRAFQRSLRQRNALLRAGGGAGELDSWDLEFARTGAELGAMRARYVAAFAPIVVAALQDLLGELGQARITLETGWRGEGDPLDELSAAREEDLRRGFTSRGPHRADWSLWFEQAPRREHLSRGQEKLCALACILAQARVYAAQRGEWPVICVDDLASELDAPHQEKLVQSLRVVDAQVLITGTHMPHALDEANVHAARFHVEPGKVSRLL